MKKYRNNILVVGNPTIDGHVVSGFSSSNYLTLPQSLQPGSSTWEVVFKVNSTNPSENSYFFGGSTSSAPNYHLGFNQNKLRMVVGNGSSWQSSDIYSAAIIQANTDYWIKSIFNGSKYSSYLSTNGIDYELVGEFSSTTPIGNMSRTVLGTNRENNTGFYGSIDLSECYIKVNGKYFWKGIEPVQTSYVVRRKSIKYYQEDINYTKVGSPVIENGIASGFSSDNYLTLKQPMNVSDGSPWGVVFKITTGSSFNEHEVFLAKPENTAYLTRFALRSGKLRLVLSNNNTSYFVEILGETTLNFNTEYYIKAEFTGSAYNIYLSENGVDWQLEASKASSTVFTLSTFSRIGYCMDTGNNINTPYAFKGSIDLSQSYIKIGDGEKQYLYHKEEIFNRKIIEKDYTLPAMTSNTAPEGIVTTNISTGTYTGNPYSLFWNRTWGCDAYVQRGDKYIQYDFAYPLAPDTYTLSLSASRQANSTTSSHNWYLVYEDDTKELILNYGLLSTSTTNYSGSLTATKLVKAIRYEATYSATSSQYIIEETKNMTLTASNGIKILTNNYNVVDINDRAYTVKRKRTKYYQEDINYTKVGSVVVDENAIASGFSTSNYLTLKQPLQPGSNTWETVFKVNLTNATTGQYLWGGSTSSVPNWHIYFVNNLVKMDVGNGSSWQKTDIAGTTTLSTNTDYWIKSAFNGSKYSLYLSTNGINYGLEAEYSSTTPIGNMSRTIIGLTRSGVTPFLGSIDLKETYIKIGDGEKQYLYHKEEVTDPQVIETPWQQPVLTNDTSYGTLTGGGYYNASGDNRDYYHISDGTITTSGADLNQSWGTNNSNAGWFNWQLPTTLRIKGIKVYNRRHGTASDYQLTGARFYTDSSKSTPIGEEFSITTSGATYTLTQIPENGIVTDNIYFYKTGAAYSGINEIEITADEITKNYNIVDVNERTYLPIIRVKDKENITKPDLELKDWVRPILVSNGTLGGDSFAVYASTVNTNGNYNAYRAVDGDSSTWWLGINNTLPEYIFYNPTKLVVSNLSYKQGWTDGNYYSKNVSVLASNDNVTYTSLGDFETGTTANISLPINTNGEGYHYYKIKANETHSTAALGFNELNITAKEIIINN